MKQQLIIILLILSATMGALGQKTAVTPAGKLFIIGGGDRSQSLMQSLVTTAGLQKDDYIVVLPMSSENPDTSFYYIKEDLRLACGNKMVSFNFTTNSCGYTPWLDSLEKAKLVFITGGDQSRFMKIVLNTPVYTAIHKAFARGATIAGTSAGAAMMSKIMITGNQLEGDGLVSGPFTKIQYNMVEVKEGLGLITNAIIDQHFIVRSRYNRLLSVLAANPGLPCIGIDEATAIIVTGKKVRVTGESQVIRFRLPNTKNIAVKKNKAALRNVQLDIFVAGDNFLLD